MIVRRTRWVALCAGLGALSAIPALGGRQEVAASRAPLVVEVRCGDSLWTIARKHGDPDRDIREVVWRISEENKVDPGNLQPGDEIVIPPDCLP